MVKIRPDKIILTSLMPGFGYVYPNATKDLVVSGTVSTGGRTYTTTLTIPDDVMAKLYYSVGDSTELRSVDGSPTAAISLGGNSLARFIVSQSGTTLTITVEVVNNTGSSKTIPTQTIHFTAYLFRSLF